MSEEWEGALDAMEGSAPAEPQPQSQGGVAPGDGTVIEREIEPGKVPEGVETSQPQGDEAKQSRKPAFMKPAEVDEEEVQKPDAKQADAKQEPPKKRDGIAALRESYELTKAEKAKLEAKVAELERTRDEGTKAEIAKATEALRKEVEDIRKAREEAEQELRYANYTKSHEYRQKYTEPLQAAWKAALEDINGIQVTDGETGNVRDVSARELQEVILAKSAGEASLKAREIFGDAAAIVMQHRADILRIDRERENAIKTYREKGDERQKQLESQQAERASATRKAWEKAVDETVSERPALYARPKDDDALGKAWDDGDKLVKLAMLGEIPPEVDAASSEDREALQVQAQAEIAARVRGFNVMAHRNAALRKEVSDLKAALQKLKGSEPGQTSKPTDAPKAKSWEDALEEL